MKDFPEDDVESDSDDETDDIDVVLSSSDETETLQALVFRSTRVEHNSVRKVVGNLGTSAGAIKT